MNIEAVSNSAGEVDNKAILAQFGQYDDPKPTTAMRDGELRARVAELMESGIEPIAIARKANVHSAEFKRWQDGKDEPGVAMALSLWFEVIDAEGKAAAGDFVETPTARRILKAFEKARQDKDGKGQRGICLAYGASSAGKSTAAEYYESTENLNPSWGQRRVLCVRAGEVKSKTLKGLLHLLVADLDAKGIYCDPNENPMEKVLKHVPEGGLLIFDEAQFLPMRRLDELRIFPDKYKIAVAFMGNMAGYKKLEAAKITQIARRVGGARVIIELPCEGDVDALLEAYDIGGHKVREMALVIGIQDGGLGMLCDTMRTAKIYANASGKKVDEDIFKAAAFSVGAWGEGQ
jgi:DNA transposition AAA+ family ATPase